MNNVRNILWGLVLITVGVLIGLNTLEITNINIFFDGWWTLFIIVPCFINLFKDDDKTASVIGLVIGVLLLISCQDLIEFDLIIKLIFPIILVGIGISFIFKNSISRKTLEMKKVKKGSKECTATFSGEKLDYSNQIFDGCKMNAIFGGIECDLRNAEINNDVVIDVTAIFGGIDIFVPNNCNVVVTSTSIFGGVDNKTKNKKSEKTIYINATCLFGGVDIND